ncbi:MAG: methyltransferase domain-containing protein, partial [Actinomycetota bacterium]
APAVLAAGGALPLADGAVDAALAVLSLHHYPDPGTVAREMRRVARGRVAVVTWDPSTAGSFWLVRDYLPSVAAFDAARYPRVDDVAAWLGGASVTPLPIPHDCRDGFLGAYWRRPEAYLDPRARAGTSALREGDAAVAAGLSRLAADLADGTWRVKNGHLLRLDESDVGYRLIVAAAGA